MTKKVIAGSLALLAVTAMYAQTYQLPNVGFENWENAKGIIHASSGNALSTHLANVPLRGSYPISLTLPT